MEKQYINSQIIVRLITTMLLAAILITLFLPWIHIGSEQSDLSFLLQNSYYSVSDLVEEFIDMFDIGDGDFSDRLFAYFAKRLTRNLEDCKLSLAELTESLLEITSIVVTAAYWNSFIDFFSDGGMRFVLLLLASLLFLWCFLVLLLGALRGILGTIKGSQTELPDLFTPFAVSVVLLLIFTAAANSALKDFLKELIWISIRTVLHVKTAPFIGLIVAGVLKFVPRWLHWDAVDSVLMRLHTPKLWGNRNYLKKFCYGAGKKAGWRCECGVFNMFNANYCQKCGSRRPDKPICSSCGTSLKDGSRFCHICGTRVVYEKKRTCRHCGETLPRNASFCGKCGEKAEAAEESAPNHKYKPAMEA